MGQYHQKEGVRNLHPPYALICTRLEGFTSQFAMNNGNVHGQTPFHSALPTNGGRWRNSGVVVQLPSDLILDNRTLPLASLCTTS